MLYSRSQSSEKFDLFSLFVAQYLSGSNTYKEVIDHVIQDVHLLSKGEKTIFDIDRDKFQIIIHLKDSDSSYFEDIDPTNLQKKDYRKISNLLGKRALR